MTAPSKAKLLLLGTAGLIACGKSSESPVTPDARPPADAAPMPDAPFIPVHACPTDDLAMATGNDTNLHTRFYDSTFYLRGGDSLYHLRGNAQPFALVTTGQSYPRGGTGAQLRLLGLDHLQIIVPRGYATCPAFTPLAFQTTYFAAGFERDLVVLVDDLAGDLTHVIAETDSYAGSQVDRLRLLAESDCGDLAIQLSLVDGRELLVRRAAATGAITTVLAVGSPNVTGKGAAIPGTTDRRYGFINLARFDGETLLIDLGVESSAASPIGRMLARIDGATGAATCTVTDTDVPCQLTSARDTTGSMWDQSADTAAIAAGKIVRGGVAGPTFDATSTVQICRNGDVFLVRADHNVPDVVVIRRDNRVERVTRFSELNRSGEPMISYITGFALGPHCEVVVSAGGNGTFGTWVVWPDGTLGKIATGYIVAGFDANGNLGIRTETGAHAIARKPAGCVVPPPQ